MIEGETLEQAVDYAKSIYGTDDIIWYNNQGGRRSHAAASYAMLSGDRSAALPNPYTAADAGCGGATPATHGIALLHKVLYYTKGMAEHSAVPFAL